MLSIFPPILNTNQIPLAIIVYSKYHNIHDGYCQTGNTKFDCPIYYNDIENIYLFKITEEEWVIGINPDLNQYYMISSKGNTNSPDLADWSKNGIIVKEVVHVYFCPFF